ncbi:hypothetical protein GQ607_002644 [Colletotrichum asianum]|uniref:Uncharacterized protein n=1 Tax=Colletotrichum asianum TaxID=702518 RepID=A0A8H3WMX9_9PEZI|nr:hypothetical protein GQ607_002644 [Colletotrichum asianum]
MEKFTKQKEKIIALGCLMAFLSRRQESCGWPSPSDVSSARYRDRCSCSPPPPPVV